MAIQLKQTQKFEHLFRHLNATDFNHNLTHRKADAKDQHVCASFLLIDIRDFSNTEFQQESSTLRDNVQKYRRDIDEIIAKNDGIVNPVGDSVILALFTNIKSNDSHAWRAVSTAYKLMDKLVGLNKRRQHLQAPPLRIGISVNSSEILFKESPSEEAQSFNVLDDVLDSAFSMSDLNRTAPIHSIFVGQQTQSCLQQTSLGQHLEDLGLVQVKNHATPHHIYAWIHGH